MKISQYNPRVKVLWCSPNPALYVDIAAQITQKSEPSNFAMNPGKMIPYLIKAEHTSLLEHAVICLSIRNVSRALLAQLTRHRMASYTAGSQHYQDYRDYPVVVNDPEVYENACTKAYHEYEQLVSSGQAISEARMVLPNASTVNIMWTINARSLCNFLRLRLCKRNVKEMVLLAEKVRIICRNWFPHCFDYIGPPCEMDGKCNQGKMRAKECKNGSSK